MKTRRAILIKPGKFEIDEVDIVPKPDQVLIKISSCGLCNWELNHWKGLLGNYPQPLGHEWAGIVTDVGSEVKEIKSGDTVTIMPEGLDGFSEYAVISSKNCVKLDKSIDPKYALGEPLKCIITVLKGSAPEAGDNGIILGCGPMGLWCIQALSGNMLSSLIAVDVDDKKLELAKKFGATRSINPKREDVANRIKEITSGVMADFVIEGTGIPTLLNDGLTYLRDTGRGRLVLMSSHESICKEMDFREAIKRSVQIIVPHPGYSLNQGDDLRRAVSLLNNGTFRVKELVTHEFLLENIQEAFETFENKPSGYLKGIVIP